MFDYRSLQVLKSYRVELARWGAEKLEDKRVVDRLIELQEAGQVTALEGHLARALKKSSEEEIKLACQKYLTMFADAKPDLVQSQLWKSARSAAKIADDA